MKTTRFLTFVLAVNLIVAIASGWPTFNKALVIGNALAVLLLIGLKVFPQKER